MGYLKKLYSLFPPLGSDESCSEEEGKKIIQNVLIQHLRATELELFDAIAEELYSFNEVMKRNIVAAFERGLEESKSPLGFSEEEKDEKMMWMRSNKILLEKYLSFLKDYSTTYLLKIGHYPNDAYNDILYYNIDGILSPDKQAEFSAKLGISDYERAFISVEYNERLFQKKALAALRTGNSAMTQFYELDELIQGLFSNYLSRLPKDEKFILNAGLAWLYYTEHSISDVLKSIEKWRIEKAEEHYASFFKEMHDNLYNDLKRRIKPRKKYFFVGLTEDDFLNVYSWLYKHAKRVAESSRFDQNTFLDAIYYGDFSKIFLPGFMDKLKFTVKILQVYAEKGWVESVAISVKKRVQDINGSLGYNAESYVKDFPIKAKIL